MYVQCRLGTIGWGPFVFDVVMAAVEADDEALAVSGEALFCNKRDEKVEGGVTVGRSGAVGFAAASLKFCRLCMSDDFTWGGTAMQLQDSLPETGACHVFWFVSGLLLQDGMVPYHGVGQVDEEKICVLACKWL